MYNQCKYLYFTDKGKFSKFDINELKPTYSVSFAIWQKMKDLKRIKDFPINIIRKTYNGYGGELRNQI